MRDFIFEHLDFVRNQTLNVIRQVSDADAEIIPEGINNHIKWNAGHIYYTLESFAFVVNGEPAELPEAYQKLFRSGIKPKEIEAAWPSMEEIIQHLEGQVRRIEERYAHRLQETVKSPYTTSKGLKLTTVEEFLSFCLYHEGMHFDKIKTILNRVTYVK